MKLKIAVILSWLVAVFPASAQMKASLSYDYLSTSALNDRYNNTYGDGNLSLISGRFNLPLSFKMNEKRQPTMWNATLNMKYGILDNDGEARFYNPNKIINSGITFSHIRPINNQWFMIASLGAGIYAPHDYIRLNSILANGGLVFVYTMRNYLKIGFGGGLTTSFGAPMVMPMVYVSWERKGKYQFNIDFMGRLKVSASTFINPKLKLELVGLEMDGISAVMKINGKSKIYSSTMLKSYLGATFQIDKHMGISVSAGVDWRRTAKLRDRKINELFDFRDKTDRYFGTSFRSTVSIHYSF